MTYKLNSLNEHSNLSQHTNAIEFHLARYYRFEAKYSAVEFLGTLPQSFLDKHCPEVKNLPAALLIRNEDDDSLITIHLSDEVHDILKSECHLKKLMSSREGFNAFLILIEEVSHFHHYLRSMESGDPISRFDLELQAEIDKTLITALILNQHFGHSHLYPLTHLLFNESVFHGSMTNYELASKIAERFWKQHLKSLGKNLIFDERFRRLLQIFARKYGDDKKNLLEHNTLQAA